MARGVTQALLGAGAAVSLGFMMWAGEPASAEWWAGVIPFVGWVLLPYAILEVAVIAVRRPSSAVVALLVGALLLSVSSAIALSYALVIDVRDQSGLVFLGLPMWQIPGAVLCAAVAVVLRLWSRAARKPS